MKFFDQEPIKCKCGDCGKIFNKGDEGDNEKFCLRCERISFLLSPLSEEDIEFWDDFSNGDSDDGY